MDLKRSLITRTHFDLAGIALVSGLLVLVIFVHGIPSGNDLPEHYRFAQTFYAAMADGSIYPGWAANVNFGYGDAGVRFYPPFSYYVLGSAYGLTGDWRLASVFAFWLWFFIGGAGVYFWGREYFSNNASLAAALAYTLAPYHVNQLFNAFTYAEFAAAGILPFCFLFASRVSRYGRWRDIALLGLAYGLLVLTHLPMTVMGSAALLVYCLFSIPGKQWINTIARLGASVALGLGLSAFYWVRMVTELALVRHSTAEFVSGEYSYQSNFLLSFFTAAGTDYLDRSLWFADAMLLFTAALMLPSMLICYLKRPAGLSWLSGNLAVVIFAFLAATPLSLPIWNSVGLLQKIQFPWRWLAVLTLGAVLFIAASFDILSTWFRSRRFRPLAIVVTGLACISFAFTGSQIIRPSVQLPPSDFAGKIQGLSTGQSCECWWPIWADRSALSDRSPILVPGREARMIKDDGLERSFQIAAGPETDARLAVFYYPNWHAEMNGIETNARPGSDGTINVRIPDGDSELTITFVESRPARAGLVASALSVFCLLVALYFGSRRPEPDPVLQRKE